MITTHDSRAICGRGFIVAPGEVRFCHVKRDEHTATDHETIYQGERLSWPVVTGS